MAHTQILEGLCQVKSSSFADGLPLGCMGLYSGKPLRDKGLKPYTAMRRMDVQWHGMVAQPIGVSNPQLLS